MHETEQDLAALQGLLDDSYAAAGNHLRAVITPERRLSAEQLTKELSGVCIMGLATTSRDGRPFVAPVDGLFYRGRFWFGSAPDSLRFAHIRRDPRVSASYVPEEELAVSVHGIAEILDVTADEHAGFRDYCIDIYGSDWPNWLDSALYARIEAAKMFTFFLDPRA
jgi:general stress protein 26